MSKILHQSLTKPDHHVLLITFINNLLLFQQCSPDSLFDSDDCVLTDVNLSEASEAGLLLSDYKNKFSYSSLNSDGDSYPNSPINGKLKEFAKFEPYVKCWNVKSCALKSKL